MKSSHLHGGRFPVVPFARSLLLGAACFGALAFAATAQIPRPGAPEGTGAAPAAGEPALSVSAPLPPKPTQDLPKSYPLSRYSALMEKSPFAVASAAPEPAPTAENFATNWVVSGLAKKIGKDGKEVYTAIVRSRDLSTRLVLTGDKPSEEGISIVSVEEAPVATKSVVILKKGSETGRVEFDQANVAAAPAAPAGQPGQPVRPGGAAVSKAGGANVSRGAIPRPGMGGVPRPGASQQIPGQVPGQVPGAAVPSAAAPNGASGNQEARRRVRPIQGAPQPGTTPEPP